MSTHKKKKNTHYNNKKTHKKINKKLHPESTTKQSKTRWRLTIQKKR